MHKFRIHNEGLIYFLASIVISLVTLFFFQFIGVFFLSISFYIYYFFRDPIRSVPIDDFVISPADGVVTFIGIEDPPIHINGIDKLIKISIFLNIFNVHVNRIPTNGIIKKIKYIPGKFLNATLDKSSKENERNIIIIENINKEIFVVSQIAGLIARRIVCNIKKNQEVTKGKRFGIIKFGSRVDLYMPLHFKPLISIGQTMIAGETIIANPRNLQKINQSIKI